MPQMRSQRCTAYACSITCIRALQRHVRRATESQEAESVGTRLVVL